MKSRSKRPAEERQARARAAQHIAENPLLRGSLVSMARTWTAMPERLLRKPPALGEGMP